MVTPRPPARNRRARRRRPRSVAVLAAVAVGAAAGGTGLVGTASGHGEHRVRPGETISELAQRFGTTVDALAGANDLDDPDHVVAGRTLVVPTGSSGSSPVAASRQHLDPVFDRWAEANGIRPSLLKALCYLESGWQAEVVSSAGAVGVCQLMPGTAEHMSTLIGVELDRTDPEDSIRMGARYVRWLLAQTDGDVERALAGYVQGLASVRDNGPYAETRRYVVDVLALEARF